MLLLANQNGFTDSICDQRLITLCIIWQQGQKHFIQLVSRELGDNQLSTVQILHLFLFVAAVGINKGYRTPLSAKHGFIQNTAVPSEKYSLIFSLLTDEMRAQNTEEKISDLDEAQTVVQEYVNTGFYEIDKWIDAMNGHCDEERAEGILWDKLFELDEMYDSLFGDGEE